MLEVDGLSLPAAILHGLALQEIDLSVRAGEIVGIAGIAGNGQSELFAALSGERLADRQRRASSIAGRAVRELRASMRADASAPPSCPKSVSATRPRRPTA